MTPCLSDGALAEFVQGVSTAAEAQAIEAHVAQCSTCRQLVSHLSELLPATADERAGGSSRRGAPSPGGPAARRRSRLRRALAALAAVTSMVVAAALSWRAVRTPAAAG